MTVGIVTTLDNIEGGWMASTVLPLSDPKPRHFDSELLEPRLYIISKESWRGTIAHSLCVIWQNDRYRMMFNGFADFSEMRFSPIGLATRDAVSAAHRELLEDARVADLKQKISAFYKGLDEVQAFAKKALEALSMVVQGEPPSKPH